MRIKGFELDVNISEELEDFTFERMRIRGEKLQCCSPFRNENSPSFAINLENGLWVDSGANEDRLRKGNLITFLAYMRGVSFEEIEDYLVEKYYNMLSEIDDMQLEINLDLNTVAIEHIPVERMLKFKSFSNYLTNRGITHEIQDLFNTGVDKGSRAVSFVWNDIKGNIINIKYRLVDKKTFYYEKDGKPIRNYLYGLYQCKQKKAKRIWICESEIDALTLWSNGEYAVALGGSALSENQKKLILTSGAEEIVVATDNDGVGIMLRNVIIEEFLGALNVYKPMFPIGVKDINELSVEQLENLILNIEKVELKLLF